LIYLDGESDREEVTIAFAAGCGAKETIRSQLSRQTHSLVRNSQLFSSFQRTAPINSSFFYALRIVLNEK